MATVIKDVIFLGNYSDADSDEVDFTLENAGVYQQSFGSAGSPLNNNIEQVTFDDQDNNNSIDADNVATSDTITTVMGTVKLDSLVVAEMTVTYSDGSTVAHSNVVMFQTDDGDLFLANSNFAGTDISGTGSQTIQSINVTSVNDGYSALWHNAFQGFACYVSETLIATLEGEKRIDDLRVGDMILTDGAGAQPIRWIGCADVVACGSMVPIRIDKGALGAGLPLQDLLVSPQHRMVMNSPIVARMTGEDEAFVTAKKLLPLEGVNLATGPILIRYFHLLCDRHEVIFANGAPSETMFLGPQVRDLIGTDARSELETMFPKLATRPRRMFAARKILCGSQQRQAVQRHIKNGKPILGKVSTVHQCVA